MRKRFENVRVKLSGPFSLTILFRSTLPLSRATTNVSFSFRGDSFENKTIWQARVVVAASQVWSHTVIELKGI